MLNPILTNSKARKAYIIVWLIISVLNFTIEYAFYNFDVYPVLFDSVVYNAWFAVLGIGVWYVVAANEIDKKSFVAILINHSISLIVVIALWSLPGLVYLKLWPEGLENFKVLFLLTYPWMIAMGVLMYAILCLVFYLMLYYNNFKDKIMNEAALKTLIKETELNALKSQINPHFLFNSLNSISSLTIARPEKAQEMIIKLSDFLRYSLQHKENQKTTLDNELKHCLLYLEIEKIRFGKKLNFENKISTDSVNKLLPNMLLQPLYENAIKYSVYESTEPTSIITESFYKDNFLILKIKNSFDPESVAKKGEGIGLKNVRTRLKLEYKRDDLITVIKKADTFEVILTIPQI